eukprot:469884-Prymnesium_polylepis.1
MWPCARRGWLRARVLHGRGRGGGHVGRVGHVSRVCHVGRVGRVGRVGCVDPSPASAEMLTRFGGVTSMEVLQRK